MPSCVWVRVPSLARFLEIVVLFPGLFFLCPLELFGETLRASRFRTPLSLRDISRERMETSVAVSVARTFFIDRGVFPGLFFLRLRELFGETLHPSLMKARSEVRPWEAWPPMAL